MRLWGRRRPAAESAGLAWLIVGLGNPGPRYAGTRHNVGRDAVECLGRRHGIGLSTSRFNARYGLGQIAGSRVGLAEPLTFMNLSGQAVAPLARFYKVPPSAVLLLFDDMDLPLGTLRLRPGGGSGGHNGVASVCTSLGTNDVPRLRLGIGRPPPGWDGADYVLARFSAAEQDSAREMSERAAEAAEAVVSVGLDLAMNRFNG